MNYHEVNGDLIQLALSGNFDVIAHGCNCFSTQAAGIAASMSKHFNTHMFNYENDKYIGDYNKMGIIDYEYILTYNELKVDKEFIVVNAYTQYKPGKNFDMLAFYMCLKKMNHIFKGKHIGLPQIGCGIAGGNWGSVQKLIERELKDCIVTVVIFENNQIINNE